MPQSKIYYGSRVKFIAMFIAAIVFVAVIIAMLLQPQESLSFKEQLAAWIGIPFFSSAAIYILYILIKRKPSLVISEDGLAILGFSPLKWEEISSVNVFRAYNKEFLSVEIKDKETFIKNLSPLRRFFANNPAAKDWPLVSIAQPMLPNPIEKIIIEINERMNES